MTSLALLPIPDTAGHPASRRISARGVAIVAAAHAGIVATFAALDVPPIAPPPAPLRVDLILAEPPAPAIEIPKPRSAETKMPLPPQSRPIHPPLLAAPANAPGPAGEIPAAMDPPLPAPAAIVAPAPLTPPRFDADYLSNPAPIYPPLSRRLGEEGKVVLRVFVAATGSPGQIEIKATSGSPRLDQAARDAVWRWQFVAARRGDEAVGDWVLVPIVFNLKI